MKRLLIFVATALLSMSIFAGAEPDAKMWPILIFDEQTSEKNEEFIVTDFRPNDVDQFLYIWEGTYEAGNVDNLNFYGHPYDYLSLVVTDQGWSGCSLCLQGEGEGWKKAEALRKAIVDNPDDYFLHLAIKSTDNGSHCFYFMGSEATKFVLGSKSLYDAPIYADFERDGRWHEFFIPMSQYAEALANIEIKANVNFFIALSEGTQGVQLNLDAVFFCNSKFKKMCEEEAIVPETKYCGQRLTWQYEKRTGNLIIEGYGSMFDYSSVDKAPWSQYSHMILSTSIPYGLSHVGAKAFDDCINMRSIVWNAARCDDATNAFSSVSSHIDAITFGNGVETIPSGLCSGMTQLKTITIPNSVTSIREYAFAGCTELENITLGAGLLEIKDYAFKDCKRIMDITVLSQRVIDITKYSFSEIGNKEYVYVYVPDGSLRNYQRDTYWNEFDLKVLGATTVTDAEEDVVVTPDDNSANITWPQITNAASYELIIRDAYSTEICTLVFNSEGYLVSITLAAPARRGKPQMAQSVTGFSFTVTSLNPGSTYAYLMTAKDDNGTALDTKDGFFTTTGSPMSIETIDEPELTAQKLLLNGTLYLLRDGKIYTPHGARVE